MDRQLRPVASAARADRYRQSRACCRRPTRSSRSASITTDAASAALDRLASARPAPASSRVGIAMVALGLGFSWLIGRSITRPLNGLAGVMKRLADGDTSARIPATRARDEIGAMARTVIVFRDTMIERERLAADAGRRPAARRSSAATTIAATIAQFKHSVESALGKLRGASIKLEMSSTELNKRRRYGVGRGAHRRAARRRRLRQRHRGGQLGRGTGGLDRRDRRAGREIDRRRRPRGVGSAAHRHHHVGARQRRDPHRRGGRADPGDRRPDQSAGAQRHHRGRARRRSRHAASRWSPPR